ncbi:hypothetical protein ACFYUV_29560 [Nonomuraea sp. NPDC003560]|uniref:hypothetical protein n=1 Tax=Nonomuraea sp. NPDC003560 TaxID=3364341 RepID=UPI003677DADA
MSRPSRIVVVGASAAGLSAAEALRRDGFTGSLTLVGSSPGIPPPAGSPACTAGTATSSAP